MTGTRRIGLALLAGVVAACGGEHVDAAAWGGVVDTLPSGTVVVSSPATGTWTEATAWTVEESLRIGVADGVGPEVLGRVSAIEVAPNGQILIMDDAANELRTFTPDGEHAWTVGRAGAGPAEFRGVIGVRFDRHGDLWTVDAGNARYTIVDGERDFRSHARPTAVYDLPWLGGFSPDGMLYDQGRDVSGSVQDAILFRIARVGSTAGPVPLPAIDLPVPRVGTMTLPLPFALRMLRSWDDRGLVWQAASSDYRLVAFVPGGDTVMVVSRDIVSDMLPTDARDSVQRYARALENEFGSMGLVVPAGAIPDRIAPLRWFVPDDEGYLWVCATGLRPCSRLDVFGADGRYLGEVEMPVPLLDSPRPLVRRGNIYAMIEGPAGEPVLFRGEVVRP